MNRIRKICNYTVFLTVIALSAHNVKAQDGVPEAGSPIPVADYTLFVDPPSGFVFVKLPTGWKFVGPLAKVDLAQLPGHVVTSLLTPEAPAVASVRELGPMKLSAHP